MGDSDSDSVEKTTDTIFSKSSTGTTGNNTNEYFASYEDLDIHKLMLEDTARTIAYITAINNASETFRGKTVMDLGAGTGILSLVCANAGAKKVYAVEASNLAVVLPKIVEQNGFSDVIEVLHSKVEDLQLEKESVDIIVSEWMGFYLLHESMLDSVIFARDLFLKKSNGLLFPNKCQIYGAVCNLPELWNEQIGFWKEKHYGFDLSSITELQKGVLLKPAIHLVPPEGLLTEPQLLWSIALDCVTTEQVRCLTDRRFFSIEQDGEMHAMAVWFSVTFPSALDKEDVILSTAPWDQPTHWKQTVILLPNSINFEEGDIIGWMFSMERDKLSSSSTENSSERAYKLQLELLLDENDEHPVPCSCGSVKCEIIKNYINTEK